MRAWADVAVLAKTKNLQGGFVARPAAGLPFLLREGMEVAFVPPALDAPRRARVAEVVSQGGSHLVFFEGIEGIDAAEPLAGCHCLVRRADLPEDALAVGARGLVGWQARDAEAGFSATVADVVENPGQTLLSLERDAGDADGGASSRAVLVPLVDEFVVGFDEDARLIELSLPAGLLDL